MAWLPPAEPVAPETVTLTVAPAGKAAEGVKVAVAPERLTVPATAEPPAVTLNAGLVASVSE